jgi:hypothetical protein
MVQKDPRGTPRLLEAGQGEAALLWRFQELRAPGRDHAMSWTCYVLSEKIPHDNQIALLYLSASQGEMMRTPISDEPPERCEPFH